MRSFLTAFVLTAVLAVGSTALAQGYVAYMPYGPTPVAAYYAPPVGYGAAVGYGPVVATSYYSPYAVAYAAPVPYYAAAPVAVPYAAYYAGPVAVPGPLYYGRPVVVRPKVYIPGQPVRNTIRAVTP